jgi:hypothetical protein
MSATNRNGVDSLSLDRRPSPSRNGDNGDVPIDAPPSLNGQNGRDGRGRFAKGNRGGPGNPFARRIAQLRRALLAAVSEDDVAAVTRRLLEQAKAGDVAAARVLLAYVIGQPAPPVDPDTLDLQEWEIYRRTPVGDEEVTTLLDCVPVEVACALVRVALPYLSAAAARAGREVLRSDGTAVPEEGAAPPQDGESPRFGSA